MEASHDEIISRIDALTLAFEDHAKDAAGARRLTQEKLDTLTEKVGETRDIVEAWQAVKTGGKFLKWFGGIAVALGAIWALAKGAFGQAVLYLGVR